MCTRSHCGNFNKCTAPGDTLTAFFSDTGSTPVSSTKIKAPAVPRRVFLFWCFVSCRGVEQGGGTAVPARWPMRNADAVRSSSSVESLSLYQWFARCLNALRTARPPLMQGRHKNTTVQNLHALNTLGGDLPVSQAVSFGVALFFLDCKALATAVVRFPFRRLQKYF